MPSRTIGRADDGSLRMRHGAASAGNVVQPVRDRLGDEAPATRLGDDSRRQITAHAIAFCDDVSRRIDTDIAERKSFVVFDPRAAGCHAVAIDEERLIEPGTAAVDVRKGAVIGDMRGDRDKRAVDVVVEVLHVRPAVVGRAQNLGILRPTSFSVG
jgi:hypothetical protein